MTINGYKTNFTYREFYAERMFREIKADLPSPLSSFRVGCVGFPPAVAQYNGLYTIDGYVTNYPLAYKKKFRKIIAPELDKENQLKDYFDQWGNQCYMVYYQGTPYYDFYLTKATQLPATVPDFNLKALAPLNCRYLISAVSLGERPGLSYIKRYESELWRFHLYEVSL